MVWGAISYNWKSPLIFLDSRGKRGVQVSDYLEQALEPVVALAFQGLFGYEGYVRLCIECAVLFFIICFYGFF
jgi:hypothetical protein